MAVDVYVFHPLGTNSGRVYQALLEKGVAFTEHALSGRDFEHLRPAYLAINPKGQVPALVHDGVALAEGMLINEYIDERFDGPPLRPADPYARWVMRTWSSWAEHDLGRCLMMINWNRVVPGFAGPGMSKEEIEKTLESVPDPDRRRSWLNAYAQRTDPARIAESHARARAGAQKVEAHLGRHRYVAGDSFSLADIDLFNFCGFMLDWMPEAASATLTPAWAEWRARIAERPAVKEMRARSPAVAGRSATRAD